MPLQVPNPVLVWLEADEEKLVTLGNGIYLGHQVPDSGLSPLLDVLHEAKVKLPAVSLLEAEDKEQIVYGTEIYFGPREAAEIKSEHLKKVRVTILESGIRNMPKPAPDEE